MLYLTAQSVDMVILCAICHTSLVPNRTIKSVLLFYKVIPSPILKPSTHFINMSRQGLALGKKKMNEKIACR